MEKRMDEFISNRERLKELRKKDPALAKKFQRKDKRKKARQKAQVRNAERRGFEKEMLFNADGVKENNDSDSALDGAGGGLFAAKVEESADDLTEDYEVEYVIETLEDQIRKIEEDYVERKKNAAGDNEEEAEIPGLPDDLLDIAEDYKLIFDKFQALPEEYEGENFDVDDDEENSVARRLMEGQDQDMLQDDDEDEMGLEKVKVSKKLLKLQSRPSIPELKKMTARPDVVEVWDATSPDPHLLVWLKAYRNTVAVPSHWSHKRKYLQGKKGIDKPPFKLPEYIEATKISEIRQVIQEKQSMKTLKQKMREKVRPKMHKMDIDYQTLHDAFFKYATRPPLRPVGELYHEGKEFEMKMKNVRPGKLSETLMAALGMPSETSPPPWLFNMQRYGPPPSYPNMVIPGLNAPIPPGDSYGFGSGQWGQPPTDPFGNPLFVSTDATGGDDMGYPGMLNEKYWGEMEEVSEEEAASEDDVGMDAEGTEGANVDGTATPASTLVGTLTPLDGVESVSGLQSIESMGGITSYSSGLETPESFDVRRRGSATASPRPYTILREQKARAQPGALFASTTVYKMPTAAALGSGTSSIGPPGTGMATPLGIAPGGTITPFGFANSLATPLTAAGGAITPIMASTQMSNAGLAGAAGTRLTVALNPSEIEQEGVFAADVIRQQLKQHEEAKARTLRAAGQSEVTTGKTSKARKGTDTKAPKKKDRGFKF